MKRGWGCYQPKRAISDEKIYQTLTRPIVTEKSTTLGQFGQIVFEVPLTATKEDVKQAVEKIFKVKVESVNTLIRKGKRKVFKGRRGQRSDMKKAIVTVKEGQFIDVTAGV